MDHRKEYSSNIIRPMLSGNRTSKDIRDKKKTVQYSLELIQGSLEHLSTIKPETPPDEHIRSIRRIKSAEAQSKNYKFSCSNEMIKELIKDHERMIAQLNEKLNGYYDRLRDTRISNALRDIIEEHKVIAWTLRRYLVG